VDFAAGSEDILRSGEIRCTVRRDGSDQRSTIRLSAPGEQVKPEADGESVEWAAKSILEIAMRLKGRPGGPIDVCLSVWKDGLPVDAVPQQGWLTIAPESNWSE